MHKEIGERIKKLRQINHYTRNNLTEMTGISSKFLYEIETGKKGFSTDTLTILARTFSVSCDYLIFGESKENRNIDNIVGILCQFDSSKICQLEAIIRSLYNLSK